MSNAADQATPVYLDERRAAFNSMANTAKE
jgi:hypothetical protein